MPVTPTNNTTFQNVLNVGKNIAIGTVTLVGAVGLTAKTIALVAKPVFAKFATSALGAKFAGSTVVAILGGPIGWGLFGLAALGGTAYFGYKVYQAYKAHKAEENIIKAANEPNSKFESNDTGFLQTGDLELVDNAVPSHLTEEGSLLLTTQVVRHGADPRT